MNPDNPTTQQAMPYGQPPVNPQPGFLEAIKMAFARRNEINGRSRRAEYWWFALFSFICSWVVSLITMPFSPTAQLIGSMVVFLVLCWPSVSLSVRRMHDGGHSGYWVIILLVLSLLAIGLTLPMLSEIERITAHPEAMNDYMTSAIIAGILMIPIFIIGLIPLIFSLQDSKREINQWGPSPKYNV